jgi:hypothetical protein
MKNFDMDKLTVAAATIFVVGSALALVDNIEWLSGLLKKVEAAE